MTGTSHRLAWAPPFLAGASGAVAAEVAVGLLLYSGGGLLQAATLILTVLLGALALGLWSAPDPGLPDPVEALRRRWLVTLLAFVLAGLAATAWSLELETLLPEGAREPARQGLGLALLAALPLWAVGSLLGTMSALRTDQGRPGPGAAAAAGAAAGAVFTGVFLVRAVAPFSMYVTGVVALSAGALIHGRVLEGALDEVPEEGDAEAGAAGSDEPGPPRPDDPTEARAEPPPP